MKIKDSNGVEIELTPEELRHFKIKTGMDIRKFIIQMNEKKEIGFAEKNESLGDG